MALTVEKKDLVVRITFDAPGEIRRAKVSRDDTVPSLEIVECVGKKAAARTERIVLAPVLEAFPALRELRIVSSALADPFVHDGIERLALVGAVAQSRFRAPQLVDLELASIEGAALLPWEAFDWLLEATTFPLLRSVDCRSLLVRFEQKQKPYFFERWSLAPLVKQLAFLGVPGASHANGDRTAGVMSALDLERHVARFAHLERLVVYDERWVEEAKAVHGNVIVGKDALRTVPLRAVGASLQRLPRLEDLHPDSSDNAFAKMVEHLEKSDVYYTATTLSDIVTAFCTQRQWPRVESLLALCQKKACADDARLVRDEKAYQQVCKATEHVLQRAVAKKRDPIGQNLLDRLSTISVSVETGAVVAACKKLARKEHDPFGVGKEYAAPGAYMADLAKYLQRAQAAMTLDRLLEWGQRKEQTALYDVIRAFIESRGKRPKATERVARDLVIGEDEVRFVDGDLVVAGILENAGTLLVRGDLSVAGRVKCRGEESSSGTLWAAGSVRARAFHLIGPVIVEADLIAEHAVYANYFDEAGGLWVGGALMAPLFGEPERRSLIRTCKAKRLDAKKLHAQFPRAFGKDGEELDLESFLSAHPSA